MKKSIMKSGIVVLLAAAFLMAGCDGMFQPTAPGGPSGVDPMLRSLKSFHQPLEMDKPLVEGPIAEGDPNYPDRPPNYEGVPDTEAYKVSAAPGYDELMLLAPTSDIMWLGAIIDGNTVTTGEYRPITVNRGPLTFSISVPMGTQARTIPAASLSAVRVATSQIVTSDVLLAPPADVKFTKEFVYSEQQTKLSLGANFRYSIVSVKAGFDFSKTNIKSRMVVKYLQPYYTLDMDIPQDPSELFAPGTTQADLQNQIYGDVSPVVITSIKYGRMAIFTVESEENENALKVALEAGIDWGMGSAGASFSTENRNIVRNSTIKVYVYGGESTSGAETALSGNVDEAFVNWIRKDGELLKQGLPPVMPLAYTMRYLKDWSVSRVVLASEYWQRVVPGQGQAPVYPKYGLVRLDSADMVNNAVFYTGSPTGDVSTTAGFSVDVYLEKGYDDYGICGATMMTLTRGYANTSVPASVPANRFMSFNEGLDLQKAYILVTVMPYADYNAYAGPYTGTWNMATRKIYLSEFNLNPNLEWPVPLAGQNFPNLSYMQGGGFSAKLKLSASNP